MAFAEVISPGFFSTLQDEGRYNASHWGVPVSGAMDHSSFQFCNKILHNTINTSTIEATYNAPTLIFSHDSMVSIAGAIAQPFINKKPITPSNILHIHAGEELSFGRFFRGHRMYIGIKGGFESQKILYSQSTCPTSKILIPLFKGQKINYTTNTLEQVMDNTKPTDTLSKRLIEVFAGPESHLFNHNEIDCLLNQEYTVSAQSNRMAITVKKGTPFTHNISIISSGTIPGTVQFTPAGQLIFLMRDAQTTGGYPRIFTVSNKSMDCLAQLPPNATFRLKMVNL